MKKHHFTTDICSGTHKLLMIAMGSLMCCVAAGCAKAQQSKSTFTADAHTIMLLQPGADGTMTDAKHIFEPTVKGATTVTDASLGQVLQFGDKEPNLISVKDDGKIDFSHGMTLEMQIQLEQPDEKTPNPGGRIFVKGNSFFTTIKNNSLGVRLFFPTVPVATSTDKQYPYYPLPPGFPGSATLPSNRWINVALTYDPAMKVARTFINGKLYYTYYSPREGALPLLLENDIKRPLAFIYGAKDIRVGEIRVSDIARAIDTLTPFETYVLALPYRKKNAVIIDHILPSDLPVDVVLQSGSKQLQKIAITDPKRKVIVFDPPVLKGQYALSIKATSKGKEVYSRDVNVFAGDDTKYPMRIDDENRLVVNGKPIFPLMIYHTFIEDVPTLAKMGFTLFTARYPNNNGMSLSTRDDKSIAIAKQYLDVAKANNILMVAGSGIFTVGGIIKKDKIMSKVNNQGVGTLTNNPALGIWYGADEPGRDRIRQLQVGYTAVKQIGTRPILSVTNKYRLAQALAETTDILGVDPYPIPNVSLRDVADFTKVAVNATAGLKPVWTVIPQYGTKYSDKRPTEQELRCMAYLAIASGAQGLGIYAWDDRSAITKEGWRTGDHPEDLKILETVVGELSKMQDVLIIPNSKRVLTVTPDNPAIHVAMKESANEKYLFVVSDSRAAQSATLSIAGLQSADGVDVHSANQKVSIRNGKVLLKLPPLGTRVYKLANIQSGG